MNDTPEQRIEELNRELDALKAERNRLNGEARKWAEKRDRLHEEIKKIRSKARTLKEKRDALNDEVQRLKILRGEELRKRREKIEQVKELRQKIGRTAAKRPRKSKGFLESEIEKIDLKIQTNPLSLDEERKLVERVKTLETQLEVYRKIETAKNEIAKLEKEVAALKDETLSWRDEIPRIAEQSQRLHEKMIEELEKADGLKVEADELHKKFVENKERAKASHLKYIECLDQIKSIRNSIQQKKDEERVRKQADLQEKIEREALVKLKRGEKLTFEEFKILAERGKI